MTRTVTVKVVNVEEYSPDLINGNLAEVITALQEVYNDVPEEYRASAAIEAVAGSYYDSSHVELEVTYTRPETLDEAMAREARERAAEDAGKARRRAQFERLQREFGDDVQKSPFI